MVEIHTMHESPYAAEEDGEEAGLGAISAFFLDVFPIFFFIFEPNFFYLGTVNSVAAPLFFGCMLVLFGREWSKI
jgi:hypothetical protein